MSAEGAPLRPRSYHMELVELAKTQQPSKRAARAAAALAAVAMLHEGGALTEHLAPALREASPAREQPQPVSSPAEAVEDDAEADIAELRCGTKEPELLSPALDCGTLGDADAEGLLLGDWLLSELQLLGPHPDADAHPVTACRMALLTRAPLPPLPPLRLRARNRPADRRVELIGSMSLNDEAREGALRRFLAWAHATWFETNPGVGIFSPLAAPLAASGTDLDWGLLCSADAVWNARLSVADSLATACDAGDFIGSMVWTTHTETARAFYPVRVRDDITADTPVSDKADALSHAAHFEQRHGVQRSVLDSGHWYEAVPATVVPHNLLPSTLSSSSTAAAAAVAVQPLSPPSAVFLPSALCHLMPKGPGRCPSPLWRALTALPAQLWRLRGLLLAHELASSLLPLGHAGDVDLAFVEIMAEATTSGAAGEDVTYERLELLGDAFLKYAVSTALFTQLPLAHEGQLSAERAARVCNTSLAAAARHAGLHRYLRARRFASGPTPPSPAPLRRKALADVLEAVIGAVLVACGTDTATAVAAKFGILPASPDADASSMPCDAGEPLCCDDSAMSALVRLETTLSYTFTGSVTCRGRAGRLALLDEALTHASTSGSAPAYQRMEFLGDAVLDVMVTRALFHSGVGEGEATVGELHLARSAAVNNVRLAARAVEVGLPPHLRHGSASLHRDMLAYITSTMSAEATDSSSAAPPPPKVLADVMESLLGAVHLDCRMDLDATWRVAAPLVALHDIVPSSSSGAAPKDTTSE